MRNLDQYLPGGDVRNPGVYSPQDQTNKGKLATSFDASNLPIKSCETYYAIRLAGFKNFNVIYPVAGYPANLKSSPSLSQHIRIPIMRRAAEK